MQRQTRSAGGAIPVVYWPTDAVHVWFGLPARSFYSWEQTVGSLFNRRTAFEGLRRLLLVRPFEIARIRETGILNRDGTRLLAVCRSDLNEPAPTREDLIALCREKTLDYVVLRQPFEDLAVATNGHVFIFDCRSIRARQSADSTVAAGSAAPLPGGSVHAATGG